MTVGAILLAAGSARRMGEDKLLADLGGRPLVEHALEAILAAGLAGPLVAVAPGSMLVERWGTKARCVEVADHALGMGHSLAAAIEAAPLEWSAAIVFLGDMPFVRPDTLAMLAGRAMPNAIVRPAFGGEPGNPVLWGREHFPALARLTGDQGGRALLRALPVQLLECGDPGVLIDVDTPEALAEARRRPV
ncbi:nucleotidyltransferase family protein [Rhizorhabdus dicambivorans]|uniref:Nucleotidyltransferase family protein n=1 Tax=Rhizorhabdus dicambivorans TaxID=1850238 RepID=A0A2A4G179_9SPHN|nr:nucleotidyltransferase family protein [Rhizorhabdus dicambivorans]ATE64968.1 nucleotidyltransferase family protein [Rhizorhabdus dicambivorans]PCE44241.1 nucleotidyltransferase family protein [Rhizorhabdus dicambivorans]